MGRKIQTRELPERIRLKDRAIAIASKNGAAIDADVCSRKLRAFMDGVRD